MRTELRRVSTAEAREAAEGAANLKLDEDIQLHRIIAGWRVLGMEERDLVDFFLRGRRGVEKLALTHSLDPIGPRKTSIKTRQFFFGDRFLVYIAQSTGVFF